MQNLLEALQNADRICRQANVHFENAAQIERQLPGIPAKLKKERIKWVLLGIGVWYLGNAIFLLLRGIPLLGPILFTVGGIASFGAGAYLAFTKCKSAKEKADTQYAQMSNQIQQERNEAQMIFEENYEALKFLPDDYWYPMATEYLVKAIASQRVTTLGDALDRYDAQLHRWKVEEANAQILAQQQLQSAHLKSIEKSSRISAAANVATALASHSR